MISTVISAILQVLLFTAIPFVVYLVKARTAKGFLQYIGLKRSGAKANMLALLAMVVLVTPVLLLFFTNEEFRVIMTNPESVSGRIRQMGPGPEAIFTILIAALIKTALSEEIFFRGFLAKRLIAVTNFQTGNLLQALIFGIIHTLLFMSITMNVLFLVTIFLFPTAGAWFTAYINEKIGNGSIVPGWIAHGMANIVSYSLVLFYV